MGKLLYGRDIADGILNSISKDIVNLSGSGRLSTDPVRPGLSIVLIGDNPASMVYVGNKDKSCQKLGFKSNVVRLPVDVSQSSVLEHISTLNSDPSVHGILVQLPIPGHLDSQSIINSIDQRKDVDGLTAYNAGMLYLGGHPWHIPCTPSGIIEILKASGTEISGKTAVVVGRSNIVGKPIASILLSNNATVIMAHSKTRNLQQVCLMADIIIVAVGRPKLINSDYVKPGAVIIDVGINRVDGKLCGDVDSESAMRNASYVTPVPGGIGPMTIAMLMRNTFNSFLRYKGLAK